MITIGVWWFECVAVPLVVTNEMQRAERAVGQVLQADEFESHIFPGQQFFLFGSTIINNYQQLQEGFWGQPLSTITNNFFAPLVAIAAIVIANIVSNLIEDN